MLNGIFNNPSKYCFALEPASSDFDFNSFNFCIAFSFTFILAFIKYILCSNGIFDVSKFNSSFVYSTVF